MRKIMTLNGALNLVQRLLDDHPDSILSDGYLGHLEGVANAAQETTLAILAKVPQISSLLKEEEVVLAAALHDVGRVLDNDQLFHELRGAVYIEQKGLKQGVASFSVDVYRIAQMFKSHYMVSEQFDDPANVEQKEPFKNLDSALLIPRSWQEAIVVYSDVRVVGGKPATVEEGIADVKARYSSDPKYMSNTSVLRSFEKGLPRVIEICDRVEKLKNGTLNDAEIMQYGFL
jgi:hypothetical protein